MTFHTATAYFHSIVYYFLQVRPLGYLPKFCEEHLKMRTRHRVFFNLLVREKERLPYPVEFQGPLTYTSSGVDNGLVGTGWLGSVSCIECTLHTSAYSSRGLPLSCHYGHPFLAKWHNASICCLFHSNTPEHPPANIPINIPLYVCCQISNEL